LIQGWKKIALTTDLSTISSHFLYPKSEVFMSVNRSQPPVNYTEAPLRKRPNSSVGFTDGTLAIGQEVVLKVLDISPDGIPLLVDRIGRVFQTVDFALSGLATNRFEQKRAGSLPSMLPSPPDSARSGGAFSFQASIPQHATGRDRPRSSLSYREQVAAARFSSSAPHSPLPGLTLTQQPTAASLSLAGVGRDRPRSSLSYAEQAAAARAISAVATPITPGGNSPYSVFSFTQQATATSRSASIGPYVATAPGSAEMPAFFFSQGPAEGALSVPAEYPPAPTPLYRGDNSEEDASAASPIGLLPAPKHFLFEQYSPNESIRSFLSKPQMKLDKDRSTGDIVTFHSLNFLGNGSLQISLKLNTFFKDLPSKYISCIFCFFNPNHAATLPEEKSVREILPEDILIRTGYGIVGKFCNELSHLNVYVAFKRPVEGVFGNARCAIYTNKYAQSPIEITDRRWCKDKEK
jgi:hypothetical protein